MHLKMQNPCVFCPGLHILKPGHLCTIYTLCESFDAHYARGCDLTLGRNLYVSWLLADGLASLTRMDESYRAGMWS